MFSQYKISFWRSPLMNKSLLSSKIFCIYYIMIFFFSQPQRLIFTVYLLSLHMLYLRIASIMENRLYNKKIKRI